MSGKGATPGKDKKPMDQSAHRNLKVLSQVMDSLESSPRLMDDSRRKRRNVVWTPEMDRCLIHGLLNQVAEGMKIPNGFKEPAYNAVAIEVNLQFNLQLTKHHVINRVKTLKKDYKAIHNLLSKSGFSWNSLTKRLDVTDEVWGPYVVSHPEVKRYKERSWPLYEEMVEVYGEDHASNKELCPNTGEGGGSDEAPSPYITSAENLGVEDLPTQNDGNMSESQSPMYNSQGPSASNHMDCDVGVGPTRQRPRKRKRARDAFNNLLVSIADGIGKVAAAIRDRPAVHVKATDLLAAVEEVEGFDQDTLDLAFESLVKNPAKARAFMAYSLQGRKRFLMRLVAGSLD